MLNEYLFNLDPGMSQPDVVFELIELRRRVPSRLSFDSTFAYAKRVSISVLKAAIVNAISPCYGSIKGGEVVTISGRRLGVTHADIQSCVVDGVTWEVIEWIVDPKDKSIINIKCRTGARNMKKCGPLTNGGADIRIKCASSAAVEGISTVKFHYYVTINDIAPELQLLSDGMAHWDDPKIGKGLSNRLNTSMVKVNAVIHSLIDDRKMVLDTGIFGNDAFQHSIDQLQRVYGKMDLKGQPDRRVDVIYVDNVAKFKNMLDTTWRHCVQSFNIPPPGIYYFACINIQSSFIQHWIKIESFAHVCQ